MSFHNNKPHLVEPKIVKYYSDKIMQNKLKSINNDYYKKYLDIIINYFKSNYIWISISIIIIVLLYVRYKDVSNKKKNIKFLINKYSDD